MGVPTATPKAVSDGSSEAFGMPAGATAGPDAMPAAPSEGGSGSATIVMTTVGVTIVLMVMWLCCIGYCCCKGVCGWLFGGVGKAGGDYDLANLGEAVAAGAVAQKPRVFAVNPAAADVVPTATPKATSSSGVNMA